MKKCQTILRQLTAVLSSFAEEEEALAILASEKKSNFLSVKDEFHATESC